MSEVRILSPRLLAEQIAYNAFVRLAVFAILVSVFAVTGCYNPKVQSGGFACSATDNPPCPSGFFCVNGLCIDHPGSGGGGGGGGGIVEDMTMSISGDMAMSTGGDMAKSIVDMAGGMSTDMACFGFGHGCSFDPTCCSQCCAGGCTALGYCAL
jgi:hypothetical protein